MQNGWNDSCSIGMIPLDSGLSLISASKWAAHCWWFFVLLVLAPWPRGAVAETSKRKAGMRRCWLKHRRFRNQELSPITPSGMRWIHNIQCFATWWQTEFGVPLSPYRLFFSLVTLPRQIVSLTDLCFVPLPDFHNGCWVLQTLKNFGRQVPCFPL